MAFSRISNRIERRIENRIERVRQLQMEADFSAPLTDLLHALLTALHELRETDRKLETFGARAHGFQTHPPLSETAVRAFEAQHGIRLPADYRGFLLHAGNGGAGPYYGVFKLGEMDHGFGHRAWRENGGFVGILSAPFIHTAPWQDAADEPVFDESQESEDEYQRRHAAWEDRHWDPRNIQSAIPICHQGCAYRDWLVVTGPEAGHVWTDCRAGSQGLFPAQQAGQERLTFLQWYRAWLHDSLRALRAGGSSS